MYFKKVNADGTQDETKTAETSAGAGDAGKVPNLNPEGVIDPSMLPADVRPKYREVTAGEALTAGNMVYIDPATGKAMLADNAARASQVTGYVKDTVASDAAVKVYVDGIVTGLTGLTLNGKCYLGATGAVTATPVGQTSGKLHQVVGTALSTTTMSFDPDEDCFMRASA